MALVLRTIDLTPIQAAIGANDAETVERIAGELGLELKLARLVKYLWQFGRKYVDGIGRDFFKLAYATLHEPAGYGLDRWPRLTLLAVRAGDKLVFGIQEDGGQSKPFPKTGWAIGRWYKDPVKNRPTVAAWAADPARAKDSLIIPITRGPEAFAAGDRRGDDLLAAVVADPEDLAARLVYADWLVEQGDVRGELIRVQCDLKLPGLAADRRLALKTREAELLASVGDGIRAPVELYCERATIERGLIERVTMHVVRLAKYGPELVAQHPICRVRAIVNGVEEFARLGTLAFLANVRELEIESRKTPKIVGSRVAMKPSQLATSPIFATTKRLEFKGLDDANAEWERFFKAIDAPELEALELAGLRLGLPALELLATKRVLPSLRVLELDYPSFAQEQARDRDALVATMAKLAKRSLGEFRFVSWHVNDATMARCVREILKCKTLTTLVLENCSGVENVTLEAIGAGGARLERLVFVRNRSAHVAGFATTFPKLRALQSLDLEIGTHDGDAEVEELVQAMIAAPAFQRVHWRNSTYTTDQRSRLRERGIVRGK